MTIKDINKILSQLATNPSRDTVLEFSFTLLKWMKIEPNTGNKPQLLSPQTQKLKDYLATAPQTVQPQLYRLSADNQNIRVRFAVLKKIKKEYISQLVDNDPGLSSYQSFAKALTAQNGKGFVPTQPYFIHFVTTTDYDKLILIFNHGEQKRIVTFRDRLTNTQYNRIIQQWQDVGTKAKPEIADLFWKSLDIREVNKKFYEQIKERFDALLGIVKTQYNTAIDNQIKQFTVRQIGRYIFCWFLKEKGIIPHSLIGTDTITKTENYYQTVLLKLFFETLNTKVQDRDPLKHNKLFEKIPYLNGGLFDVSEEDRLFANLDLDVWLKPFIEILESYDFTVDESSSQYQQVAVDPEMLGRIFENLLASQNEETEKLANQRKAFGAFYTPREIVDYMVNESIRAYLQTQYEQHIADQKSKHLDNPEQVPDIFGNKKPQQLALETKRYELKPEEKEKVDKTLAPLFAATPDTSHLKKEEKALLLQFLEQIKILDPACGSGAFPMGILHKLVELNEALGTVKSSYELKKDILSQNVFGVDIMPMAIEIARLRAWLSLVLEEDYKPNDPKHNFGVKPLPNLDFKFVCANSLIDVPEDEYVSAMAADYLKQFETLTGKYFSASLEAKAELKENISQCINKITEIHSIAIDRFKLQIKREEKTSAEARLKKMQQRLDEYERQYQQWQSYKNIFIEKTVEFFNVKYFFPSVKNGFDLVIGNPPYVQLQNNNGRLAEMYEPQKYQTFARTGDIYALFYEKGNQSLKKKGILSFITSNKWMRAAYGEKLRGYFTKELNPLMLIDFGGYQVFDATVDTNILIAEKAPFQNKIQTCVLNKDFSLNNISDYFRQHANLISFDAQSSWIAMSGIEQTIKSKIEKAGTPLKDWNISIYRGVLTGFNDAFIITQETRDKLVSASPKNAEIIRPILRGRDIEKYKANWADLHLIHIPWHFPLHNDNSIVGSSEKAEQEFKKQYPAIYNHLLQYKDELSNRNKAETGVRYEWYALQRWGANYIEDFFRPKVIWKRIGSVLRFSYDETGCFCLDSTCFATGEDIKFLVGYLNSTISKRELLSNAPKTGTGDVITSVQALEPLIVPKVTAGQKKEVSLLVDRCIKAVSKNNIQELTNLEGEIDNIIFKAFSFTEEEIKYIQLKSTKLSEQTQ